jgi:hypothetical protein
MLVIGEAQQQHAKHEILKKVEWMTNGLSQQALHLGVAGAGGPIAQIDYRHIDDPVFGDRLHRDPVYRDERGAERFMSSHHMVERFLERRRIEATAQQECRRLVIGRAFRVELMQKPQPLLGKRKRG